jgi:hypothetical protein
MRPHLFRSLTVIFASGLFVLAGCGVGGVTASPSNSTFSISPGADSIDTNCTGCNATTPQGTSAEQFSATLSDGSAAAVIWSVSGGDPSSGPGAISPNGQYTPPSYVTADHAQVVVTAKLNSTTTATSVVTVTPGFLQPLTPENAALGANGTLTITGYLAEAGGTTNIVYALSNTPAGMSGGQGSLSATNCQHSNQAYTFCTVTYTAPASVTSNAGTYIVGMAGTSQSRAVTQVLLNTAGVSSNPATHQARLVTAAPLGSSGGNNNDFDMRGNQIVDCCSGTLGALIEDSGNHQYLLSNNHVLARSDHASVGDAIIEPGLIDNNCTPNGDGAGTSPVGSLTGWLALSSNLTNADAAIAQVNSGAVSATGSILELGARQPDGSLAAAPPGISSTGGKGETAALHMNVAKSGRTTGLTCASISALNLDINVDYYLDCAETKPYLTKTFTNQVAISGNQFIDAGDSGALVVDSSNAEPVGLFFAGGTDASGVSQGVANPVADVLNELSAQVGGGTNFAFVGGADHAVNCLNYGDNTLAAAQSRALTDAEASRALQALGQARLLVNPAAGILGVAMGKSSDHPGEGAVILYVDENMNVGAPPTVEGVRTVVIPTNAHAVAFGSAPLTPFETHSGQSALTTAMLNQAVTLKQLVARSLMRRNAAFFGVGLGQSLDSPNEPALVIYVDRKRIPPQLPQIIGGLRARYVVMDRMHVTRSYATPLEPARHCMPHQAGGQTGDFDPLTAFKPRSLNID